ncbi:MAG: tRNA lysidine(34) synthetase TilS [Deltaproteobacteria bacterium]
MGYVTSEAALRLLRDVRRAGAPLLPTGSRALCAVSGGRDSAALAALCAELSGDWGLGALALAHVDHRLRPSSGLDAAAARELSERLGLPFHLLEVDVGAGAGPEDAARRARYGALAGLAERLGFDRLVVGHSATDQAETVLLRLLRGTGLRGLGAMAPSRRLAPGVRLVRPLLGIPRSALHAHAAGRELPVCEDPTNGDPRFGRNALRQAWAALEALSPALERQLCRLAEGCREDERALAALAAGALESVELRRSATGLSVDRAQLAALPPPIAQRLARGLWRQLRPEAQPSREQTRRLVALCQAGPPREAHVSGDLSAVARGERLELGPRLRVRPAPFSLPLAGVGSVRLPEAALALDIAPLPAAAPPAHGPWALDLALDALRFPLELRSRRPGDRFRPAGGAGSRKLKRFLIDLRVPREARERVALLCQGEEILWVVGLRPGEGARRPVAGEPGWRLVARPLSSGE